VELNVVVIDADSVDVSVEDADSVGVLVGVTDVD